MGGGLHVLVPTRGRPELALDLLIQIQLSCGDARTRITLIIDHDDPTRPEYFKHCAGLPDDIVTYTRPASRVGSGMVGPLNSGMAKLDDADVVMYLADDCRLATPGWDRRVLDELARPGVGMATGPNGCVAMRAAIVRELGIMAPPQLTHAYAIEAWIMWERAGRCMSGPIGAGITHAHHDGQRRWIGQGVTAALAIAMERTAWELYRSSADFVDHVNIIRAVMAGGAR